ncbi:MAG: hydroxysqualene dehydroxylase HpnE [Terriglobia bacterium]
MAAIPHVIILGGGLAGLAAAIRLAEAGCDVEVLEKRPVLGGRASSFLPPGGAEPIDNCQHVLLGCCTNLLDFFRRAGTADHFRFYNRFLFLGTRGVSEVGSSLLPAPFHLLPSLVSFQDLTWRDRWAIARAMFAILRNGDTQADEPSDGSMLDWLRRQRQAPQAIEHFWRAILTSALNEDLERLSRRHAFHVFWEAFLRNRRGYRMGVPTTSLGDLYASERLRQMCRVSLGTPVARLVVSENRVRAIALPNGEERSADFYISAVPPDALARLLPAPFLAQWPALKRLAQLEWSPITGIHLWFDRPITDLEHAAILGRTVQWLFNKNAIARRTGPSSEGHYVQFVVSASRSLMTLRRDEIIERVLGEIRELFPASRDAKLLKAVVVKEAESTISFPPGSEALRPGAESPLENLFLAGDWTATGWPPTMEGAVRSGYRAAERITAAAGNPQQFVVPDLPTDFLARCGGRWWGESPALPGKQRARAFSALL